MENKVSRLESVLTQIEQNKNSIEKLEQLLLAEYNLEGGNSNTHDYQTYGWNLKETINGQLREYKLKVKRSPKKESGNEYYWFLERFIKDVSDELNRLKREKLTGK